MIIVKKNIIGGILAKFLGASISLELQQCIYKLIKIIIRIKKTIKPNKRYY